MPLASELDNIATDNSKDFNLQAARESLVLTKNNENVLPMNKNKKILVTGTTAGNLRVLNGGWSYKWQGDNEDYFKKYAKGSLTNFDALKQKKQMMHVYILNIRRGCDIIITIQVDQVSFLVTKSARHAFFFTVAGDEK